MRGTLGGPADCLGGGFGDEWGAGWPGRGPAVTADLPGAPSRPRCGAPHAYLTGWDFPSVYRQEPLFYRCGECEAVFHTFETGGELARLADR